MVVVSDGEETLRTLSPCCLHLVQLGAPGFRVSGCDVLFSGKTSALNHEL